jgi:ISXO2-like transposase domain
MEPFGGEGADVQVDETYFGNLQGVEKARGGFRHKMRVVSLLDKRTGRTRSVYAPSLGAGEVANIVRSNVLQESHLVTDESRYYWRVGKEFDAHSRVFHGANNYVTNGRTTNDLEGFFSIFKRGMRGVYQFCNEKHLHRYLAEFDFRYSNRVALGYNDNDRADILLSGIVGKRLTYQQAGSR